MGDGLCGQATGDLCIIGFTYYIRPFLDLLEGPYLSVFKVNRYDGLRAVYVQYT